MSAYIHTFKGRPRVACEANSADTMGERLLESWTAGEATSPTSTEKKPLRVNHDEETPLLSSRRGDNSEEVTVTEILVWRKNWSRGPIFQEKWSARAIFL